MRIIVSLLQVIKQNCKNIVIFLGSILTILLISQPNWAYDHKSFDALFLRMILAIIVSVFLVLIYLIGLLFLSTNKTNLDYNNIIKRTTMILLPFYLFWLYVFHFRIGKFGANPILVPLILILICVQIARTLKWDYFGQGRLFCSKILQSDLIIITFLYVLAHGLMLFNKGIFWDDWTLYNINKDVIIDNFKQVGFGFVGTFHNFLISFGNTPFVHHLLTFFSYFFAGLLLNAILKRFKMIDLFSRLFIVLFFILLPVNSARITMINVPYGLCYFLFFLGLWLTIKYLESRNLILRIVSLGIFMISFVTNSLLVFYLLVIFYLVYDKRENINSIFSLCRELLFKIDYLLIPIVYWIVKSICFVPYGKYTDYNQITFEKIWLLPSMMGRTFFNSFDDVLKLSFNAGSFLVLICAIILAMFIERKYREQPNSKYDAPFFILGVFVFILGIFAYNVVELIPDLYDWNSRHQLLVPLGSSLIIYYGLKYILDKFNLSFKTNILVCSFLIFLFINFNIKNYVEYQTDWYKQLSIIENLKSNDTIRNNSTFLFADNAADLNAKYRSYRFYEYTGLLKYAFGDESRFGGSYSSQNKIEDYRSYFTAAYNLGSYKETNPQYLIIIDKGSYVIYPLSVFRLMYFELFAPDKFKTAITNIVTLNLRGL